MSALHETSHHHACWGPGYASPEAAMNSESEKILYTIALYTGTGIEGTLYWR